MKRTEKEINDEMYKAMEISDTVGTKFSGMSYEQGIKAALEWVLGESDDKPTDD